MRIGIVNVWHDDNRGDSAIVLATERLLSETFPGAAIEFWSVSNSAGIAAAHRVLKAQLNDPVIHPAAIAANQGRSRLWIYAPVTVGRAVRAAIGLALPRLNPPEVRALAHLDLVVASGGHYLYSHRRLFWAFRMFRLIHPLAFALRHRVPVVLIGHSLGPFEGRLSRKLARGVLSKSARVYVREELSAQTALDLGVPPACIRVIPDPAFATVVDELNLQPLLARHGLKRGEYWAITVRKCLRGTSRQRVECTQRFLTEMARFVRMMLDSGVVSRVALIPHVIGPTAIEDDRQPTSELAELLAGVDGVVTIDEDFTPGRIAAFYGAAELVVGTRFHSVILALVAGTPAYAVSYFGPKAVGIMEMANMSDACVEMEDFTAVAAAEWIEASKLVELRTALADLPPRFESELVAAFEDLRGVLG